MSGNDSERSKFVEAVFLSGLSAGTAGLFSYATESFKAASFVNGGSAAAVLALISQAVQKQPPIINVPHLKLSLIWFAGGLICSAFSAAASYLSQYAYQRNCTRALLHRTPC
jgi:hypothetical protein